MSMYCNTSLHLPGQLLHIYIHEGQEVEVIVDTSSVFGISASQIYKSLARPESEPSLEKVVIDSRPTLDRGLGTRLH